MTTDRIHQQRLEEKLRRIARTTPPYKVRVKSAHSLIGTDDVDELEFILREIGQKLRAALIRQLGESDGW